MYEEQCSQGEWNTMGRTNKSKENEWALIHSNQVMENDQITNVCNDGEDNDSESLGKGHSFLMHKIHNEIGIRRWKPPESSHTNFHKQLTQKNSYQWSISYIQTLFFSFFFHSFFFCFFLFLFFCFFAHTLNINKWTPLRIHNEMDILSNNDVHELSLTKWPSQLRISEPMSMR